MPLDIETFPGPAWVHYGQIELEDAAAGEPVDWGDFFQYSAVGLVGTRPGHAIMLTGRHTGTVGFQVMVAAADPGADTDGYEDIVEIDLVARSAQIRLVEWGAEEVHDLPTLPAGPGNYRLRYHARGMDAGADDDPADEDVIVDEYLLQIWPAPPTGPVTVKATSAQIRYWQSDKRAG